MRVHHLNCGTCCPVGGRLFDGRSRGAHGLIVCHCLLIETDEGLVLVDTGFGARDVARPRQRLSEFFLRANNIQLREEETALSRVRALGFDPGDVRHVVLTHLDFDHAGGLEDFPRATVHVTGREKQAAEARDGGAFTGPRRYRPLQWDEGVRFQTYPMGGGEAWFGMDAVRGLEGLPPEILMVPLPGHTHGHVGVAVDRGGEAGWMLHAGDAYFYEGEMARDYRCTPMLRGYQAMMEVDRRARLANLERVRRLALDHAGEVEVFCAHDAAELDRMQARAEA